MDGRDGQVVRALIVMCSRPLNHPFYGLQGDGPVVRTFGCNMYKCH